MTNLKLLVLNKAHQIIQQSDYQNKDNLYYILYVLDKQINKHKTKNDDIGDDKGYVYIPNGYFNSILSNRQIQKSKQFLIDNKIIDCDNMYNYDPEYGDLKALGYKYNDTMYDLFSEWVEVELCLSLSKKIKKRIAANKVKTNIDKINKLNNNYKPLHNRHKLFPAYKHFIDTFDIDDVKALKHIEDDFNYDYQNLYNYFFIQGLFFFDKRHYNNSSECKYTFTKINQPEPKEIETNDYFNDFLNSFDNDPMFNSIRKYKERSFSGAVDCGKLDPNKSKNQKNNNNVISIVSHFNQTPSIIDTSKGFSTQLFNDFITEKKKIIKRKLHRQSKIKSIKNRKYFRQNITNGRIDTNLTTLSKKYKQYITSPHKLVSIDISNSQPYFLSLYLNKLDNNTIDKNELDEYTTLCKEGKLYDTISKKTKKDRDEIKQEIIERLFKLKKYNDSFRNTFPTIMNYLDQHKRQITNSKFAIDTQRLESDLCIDKITTTLFNNNIPCYTIHDSWLVYQFDLDNALYQIKTIFSQEYNSIPNLKIEPIN